MTQNNSGSKALALSVADFCARYRLGRTRVFEEIARGRLRSYKVGRRRFISRKAAYDWQIALEKETAEGEQ